MIDYPTLSDQELEMIRLEIAQEVKRRRTVANTEALLDSVIEANNPDRADGAEWVQPTGATDAYTRSATVTHGGKTWESLTPANVWEPGVSGWREVVAEDAAPPEFVHPTGAHDTYNKGDRVTYQGAVYTSLIDNNAYSPSEYPQGWTKE